MSNPFPTIHCECGEIWTQEMHTVCPVCASWPKRADLPTTPVSREVIAGWFAPNSEPLTEEQTVSMRELEDKIHRIDQR